MTWNLPTVVSDNSQEQAPPGGERLPGKPENIPAHVWALLQEAGEIAAQRLLEELQSAAFSRLKPGDKARLIELALTRSYGPPIKREMTLSLSGTVSDAVAESLGRLASSDIPEMRRQGGQERRKTPSEGHDT